MESNRMSRHVYLDHNASTPSHPEVVAEMLPYFSEIFGNPSSIHAFGREARDGVDRARERVAPSRDRKSTRLNSSHGSISYAVFCLKKKKSKKKNAREQLRSYAEQNDEI